MIHVDHLTVAYGPVRALEDVSLDVKAGECVLVSGPSGCSDSSPSMRSVSTGISPMSVSSGAPLVNSVTDPAKAAAMRKEALLISRKIEALVTPEGRALLAFSDEWDEKWKGADPSAVPEPSTCLLLALAGVCLLPLGRRRSRAI